MPGGAAVTSNLSVPRNGAAFSESVAAIATDAIAPRHRASSTRTRHTARAFYPCSPASTSTRANVTHAVGLRPSAFVEDSYGQEHRRPHVREDHSQRARHARREACRCGSGLRSRCRSAQRTEAARLLHLGTSRWREKRDVPRPAVLRQRSTSELRVAASRTRRAQCTGPHSEVHPRRVQPRRSRLLNGPEHTPRRPAPRLAAWAHLRLFTFSQED